MTSDFDRKKLAESFSRVSKLNSEDSLKCVNEFLDRFMVLKRETNDREDLFLTPPRNIELLWRHALYRTKEYSSFCTKTVGFYVHYDPSNDLPEKAKVCEIRYARTVRAYELLFGISPPKDIWPTPLCNNAGRKYGEENGAGSGLWLRYLVSMRHKEESFKEYAKKRKQPTFVKNVWEMTFSYKLHKYGLSMKDGMTIAQTKEHISRIVNVPPEKLVLSLNGLEMDDVEKNSDYGICEGSHVYVSKKLALLVLDKEVKKQNE